MTSRTPNPPRSIMGAVDYAAQHLLTASGTGLADTGWTGQMAGSLIRACQPAGTQRPAVLFWGHEPRLPTRLDRP
jgi:hypothetical protein